MKIKWSSRRSLPLFALLLLCALVLAGCGGTGGPEGSESVAPTTVASDPAGQETVASSGTGSSSQDLGKREAVSGGSFTRVSPTELRGMLEDKDFAFVNVHIPFEGDIARTDLSVPYDEIDRNLDRLPEDKGDKIVLYCRTGSMSAEAAGTLARLGYTNVWDLEGGMVAWEKAGLPLEGT